MAWGKAGDGGDEAGGTWTADNVVRTLQREMVLEARRRWERERRQQSAGEIRKGGLPGEALALGEAKAPGAPPRLTALQLPRVRTLQPDEREAEPEKLLTSPSRLAEIRAVKRCQDKQLRTGVSGSSHVSPPGSRQGLNPAVAELISEMANLL